MGLTWIDYETIDKPIEEIAQGTGEADEIQFHVETLSTIKEQSSHGDGRLGKSSKKDSIGGMSIKVRNVAFLRWVTYNLRLELIIIA